MTGLPNTVDSLLVRTDFSDDDAWNATKDMALAQNDDGFRAYVHVVDDALLAGAAWQDLRQAVMALQEHAAVLFVVDGPALRTRHPIQVVDLKCESHSAFRCVARELWCVDNNLNLANMDWEEFADRVDAEGVFRGFS